jgi:hypothetical protein
MWIMRAYRPNLSAKYENGLQPALQPKESRKVSIHVRAMTKITSTAIPHIALSL